MAMPSPTQPQGQTLQLHDIHTPEQISNFPIAPGWWILTALIIIAAVWFYKKYQKSKQVNAIKKQALLTLESNPELSAKACIRLLKSTAMHYFSRQVLAKMYGDAFQQFLVQQLPEKQQKRFLTLSAAAFAAQYQATDIESTDTDCYQATKLWLTHALPVKKTNKTKRSSLDDAKKEPLQEKELSA